MTILLNCSNLKAGGGLQVADSICCQLNRFPQHRFVVVLSSQLEGTKSKIADYQNVETYHYDISNSLRTVLLGRDKFLDALVQEKCVDVVLTVFGPSRWIPRCNHLCGFARAQLLLKVKGYRLKIKDRLAYAVWGWAFRRCSKVFYTENPYISQMLPRLLGDVKVFTVTNYYHQVFDQPERWKRTINLNANANEKMVTMLTVSSTATHKNLEIMVPAAEYLEQHYPNFKFRFVLTCDHAPFELPEKLTKHFVFICKVDVEECPNLYEQADIMLMPTLMECFTATYPEAMRMGVPIVTTDLEFAHGLCGDAACYYEATNAEAAAEAIYRVATDKEYARSLTAAGKLQLQKFDNYEQRAEKLVRILEVLAS